MKNQKLTLRNLKVLSFVTTLQNTNSLKGGTLCPEETLAGPGLCITGDQCQTRIEEGCHSTGNTDDPTGFETRIPALCINNE